MDRVLVWSEEMSLGVPAMDKAHKFFLDELARLSSLVDEGIVDGFTDLVDYLERDFQEEEGLMDRIPGFIGAGHREDHAKVMHALRHAAPEILTGDVEMARQTLRQLSRWFLNHLSSMDLPLAVAYEMNGRHYQPPPAVWLRSELARQLYRNGMVG